MTKFEALRETVIGHTMAGIFTHDKNKDLGEIAAEARQLCDDLIIVVEERLKEKIRNREIAYDFGSWKGCVAVPADVLAPSEEFLREQTFEDCMEDQQREDMLAEDLKRHQQQADRERFAQENP